jgi:hypothetical protein
MKSDVKKKMTLVGHPTRTPKSLKGLHEENSCAPNQFSVRLGGNFPCEAQRETISRQCPAQEKAAAKSAALLQLNLSFFGPGHL